jgi:hypothetical protein
VGKGLRSGEWSGGERVEIGRWLGAVVEMGRGLRWRVGKGLRSGEDRGGERVEMGRGLGQGLRWGNGGLR